jgi:hypothetical protein
LLDKHRLAPKQVRSTCDLDKAMFARLMHVF